MGLRTFWLLLQKDIMIARRTSTWTLLQLGLPLALGILIKVGSSWDDQGFYSEEVERVESSKPIEECELLHIDYM
ncbi:hypothetical protein Y032_0007g3356 [Ancylostoma ceylanicum]|uniref:Uncharacterized protein n=1 Tax=Ancylostoma ceylanicum TaxID=53326 RepID=A0A016VN00_9BILA|nr:hypothetical protein Y032_0007g3356 [Ancylostoma ceylanicum]